MMEYFETVHVSSNHNFDNLRFPVQYVLRPETEWIELGENKTALLADADISKITEGYYHFL